MADWYVSSTAYAAIPTFQASHAYSVGDIIRPTSPAGNAQYPQRCTTAGTSGGTEPAWNTGNNGTTGTGSNGCVFTNVGGQSTYGWSAACGTVASLAFAANKNVSPGDRVFVSSDHSESAVVNSYAMYPNGASAGIKMLSVSKAGSVPPVAADLPSGAPSSISVSPGLFQTLTFDAGCPMLWQGFTFTVTTNANIQFNSSGVKNTHLKNCALVFSNGSGGNINVAGNPAKVLFENTTLQVANSNFKMGASSVYPVEVTWINTPSLIQGATIPSTFIGSGNAQSPGIYTFRGTDLSAITGTLVGQSGGNGGVKVLFEGCKINSSVTRYSAAGTGTVAIDEVELVNCFDGTNTFSERYVPAGALTTDRSTYMTGGAADDTGGYSHKMVSNALADIIMPMESFWLDVQNSIVGSVVTATVELVSSASLNNTDIKLLLEYEGTSGSPVTSFVESLATVLTAPITLTASSAGWNSPPSTPVYQKLQVTFTPQTAGRVRARVQLAKTSKTVWVNPQITIT